LSDKELRKWAYNPDGYAPESECITSINMADFFAPRRSQRVANHSQFEAVAAESSAMAIDHVSSSPYPLSDSSIGSEIVVSSSVLRDPDPAFTPATTPPSSQSDCENIDPEIIVLDAEGTEVYESNEGRIDVPTDRLQRPPIRFESQLVWWRRSDESSWRERSRAKRSAIWAYGEQVVKERDASKTQFCCNLCVKQKRYKLLNCHGTNSIKQHLRKSHNIRFPSDEPAATNVLQQQRQSSPFFWFQIEQFKRLFIRWIVFCHIAFVQIENTYFRELLSYFNSRLAAFVPSARYTVRKWLLDEFKELRTVLKDDILNSRSKVSISFDLWSSPNFLSMIAVCGHFIDNTGKRRHVLLALRRVDGSHTAENIKAIVVSILREYHIDTEDKVGYFMLDNASNCDAAVRLILQELFPHWTDKRIKRRRLRCLGHVVNIAAKKFLDGDTTKDVFRGLKEVFLEGPEEEMLPPGYRGGALLTLHSLIRYIRMTPERRETFANTTVGGEYTKFDGLEVSDFYSRCFGKGELLKVVFLISVRLRDFPLRRR
jgi:hypothetical protein